MKAMFMKMIEITALVILLTACSSGGGGTSRSSGPSAPLTSISVAPANTGMAPGTTKQFTATGTYANNTHSDITTSVTWTSSDTTIAAISNAQGSQGIATATASFGTTTITAALGNISGITTLATSTVVSIGVSPPTSSIAPLTAQKFSALGTLETSDQQDLTSWAVWTSSDPSVAAIVSGSAIATAGTVSGSTIISATYSGATGSAVLVISPVTTIAISPMSASIANGTAQQFAAAGILADNSVQSLTKWATWFSSNSAVATISNNTATKGLVTSLSTGTTFITAMFDSVSSPSATLTVTPAVLTSITITPAAPSIPLGKTQQFIAIGTFSDGSNQDISSSVAWTSSKTAVATISNTGLATSVAEGTTTITAGMSGVISNAAALTVTPAELVSIIVSPLSHSIALGATLQYTATGIFGDGTLQDLTKIVLWSSSNTSVATFSITAGFQGVAIASSFNTGTATITASFSGITSNNAVLTVTFF